MFYMFIVGKLSFELIILVWTAFASSYIVIGQFETLLRSQLVHCDGGCFQGLTIYAVFIFITSV